MDDIKGDDIMLTVFLKHDQSQALDEFQTKLDQRGWWDNFPPEGVEIVSWYVVMGFGQIATRANAAKTTAQLKKSPQNPFQSFILERERISSSLKSDRQCDRRGSPGAPLFM